ncbi:nephrin-like [Tubulanus polymorphus]|uniref:nephrin-like n=1 Tax=Tubulanus polymorphus TaxID=672921 RepID=UPI003DA356CD
MITTSPATSTNKLSIKQTSTVTLTCDAAYNNASPPINYSWKRTDGEMVTGTMTDSRNTNIMTFTAIRKTDAASYTCTASNKVGSQLSSPLTIEIYYPPDRIELTPPGTGVSVGSTARWRCVAIGGNPAPRLSLFKQRRGSVVWDLLRDVANGELIHDESAKVEDNGAKMKCSAVSAGITNQIDSLVKDYVVYFMPTDIIMSKTPDQPTDTADTKKTITCQSTSSNPATDIVWDRTEEGSTQTSRVTASKTSGEGANGGIVTTSTVVVDLREQDNRATYTCRAKYNNTNLGYQRSLTLNVLFPPLNVHLTHTPHTAIPIGQRKSLTCMTDSSNPTSTITWYRRRLPTNQSEIITTGVETETIGAHSGKVATHTINFNATRADHRAIYTCVVKYQNNNKYKEKSITLNVYYPPVDVSVKSTPGSPVTENDVVTLKCEASNGFPMNGLVYQWEKHEPGKTIAVGANSATYVLNRVKPEHSGGYVCKVTNSGGTTISSVFNLDVNYGPKLQKTQSKVVIAGKIGGALEFTFVFVAKPRITACTCRRKDNNAGLPSNAVISNQNNANVCKLKFQSIKTSDFGTYVCSVINIVSDLSFDVELKTPGPPDKPRLQTLLDLTSTSATIQWQAGFQGGSPQTFTIEYQTLDQTKWQQVRNIPDPGFEKIVKYKVTGLDPASQYRFRIQAINKQPTQNWSPYTDKFFAFTKAAPTMKSKEIKVTKSGPSVTISWKDINYGGVSGDVIDIRIKYCNDAAPRDSGCDYHRISEFDKTQKKTTFTVDESKSFNYYLQILDSEKAVFTSETLIDKSVQAADMQNIIIGVVAAIVVILVIVIVAVVCLRRQRLNKKKAGADCSKLTSKYAPIATDTSSGDHSPSDGNTPLLELGARPKVSPRKRGKASSPMYENQPLPNPDVIPDESPYQNVGMMVGPGFGPDSYDENPYQNVRMSSPKPEDIGADGTVYADLDIPSLSSNSPSANHPFITPGNNGRPKQILGDLDASEYAIVDFTRPGPDLKTLNSQMDKSRATVV